MENEKKIYEGQVRGTNRYFNIFYTQDLPKSLKKMEEFLLRRVVSIQDVLKKLLLIRKISTEKMVSINNDVLSYLDEIDSESELNELLEKYNPDKTPFVYTDMYEYQEYKGLDTIRLSSKPPQLMHLIPQVDPSTLCQGGRNGSRNRTFSDPESENSFFPLPSAMSVSSVPSLSSSSSFSGSAPPPNLNCTPASPLNAPINIPSNTIGININSSIGTSSNGGSSVAGIGSSNSGGGSGSMKKSKKKSIMGFRLHRKSVEPNSIQDNDGVPGAARKQVFADAAAAAKERSTKSKQHRNGDGQIGGYRGSTGRQGHISVDYTEKFGTLFSSSASLLPSISKPSYSGTSSTLSSSPDPFSAPLGSPGSSPLKLAQQQSLSQLNSLPSISGVARSSSVAAIPMSPPMATTHDIETAVCEKKVITTLFGTPLRDLPVENGKQVPSALKFFIKGMIKANAQETPNIFKRGGKAPLIAAFKKELNEGTFNYNSDPYVSADVFKLWIRSLPDPLIPNDL